MGRISLEGLEFQANHGVYESERVKGNSFSVDVSFDFNFEKAAKSDDLSDTIDYESVYAVVDHVMSSRVNLLESLAQRIAQALREAFPDIDEIEVIVSKFEPPIKGKCKKAVVAARIS